MAGVILNIHGSSMAQHKRKCMFVAGRPIYNEVYHILPRIVSM